MRYEIFSQFRRQNNFMYATFKKFREQIPQKRFNENDIFTVLLSGKTLIGMMMTCKKSYTLLRGKTHE